jgi:replicative DNA helicase
MNNEIRLLNRALQDKELTPLFIRGINETWFTTPDAKSVWTFIRNHFSKYGECPSVVVIKQNFPTYVYEPVEDSMDYLVDELLLHKRKLATNTMIREAIENIEKGQDHESALIVLQRGLVQLEEDGLNANRDLDITDEPMLRWAEYQERKHIPNGLLGIATGFDTIDRATSGLQKGQLVVVVAPPKTGKSTLALQMANNIHRTGNVPLFMSFEMTNQEQVTRYDSMRAQVSHHRLRTGALTNDEEKRYEGVLKDMETEQHRFWLADSAGTSTVSMVASKIQTLQPDVVFLDGVYLMHDEVTGEVETPRALTSITRSLKRVAQRFQVPIVISTQVLTWKMKKGNVTADSIGYSSSFFQDADVLFGLQREDENVDDTRLLKVLASRNTGPTEVSRLWDWNNGQFRELGDSDL